MKKALMLAGIAVALVAITVVQSRLVGGEAQTVDVQAVAKRTIRSSILASGTLTYRDQALLTSEIIGKVKAVHVQEGDSVVRGQLVLEIDDQQFRADVDAAEAQVVAQRVAIARAAATEQQTARQLARSRTLHGDRLVSTEFLEQQRLAHERDRLALDAARAQLDLARSNLARSRNGLSKTRILSPLDGVVIAVDIEPGETAIPSVASIAGSELMRIANPASIHAEVFVDEADIGKLRIGDRAEVVITSAPDQPLKGRVQHIATSAQVAPGRQGLSFAVEIAFDAPPRDLLRPGVSCRAEIFVESRQSVITAPIEATLVEESQSTPTHYVFVVHDGGVERTEVKLGISDDDYQQIVSGLSVGDVIVTGPDGVLRNLRTGDAVDVRKEP